MLGSVLPPILQGLKELHLAQSVTMSLKEVLKANQEHIMPYMSQILTASKAALETSSLRVSENYTLFLYSEKCEEYIKSVFKWLMRYKLMR